jgi:predicted transcriptional regulator
VTKLLEQAVQRLRQLPDTVQDSAARVIIAQLEEEPEPGDLEAIRAGREDFAHGRYVTVEEWRNEMGLGDH